MGKASLNSLCNFCNKFSRLKSSERYRETDMELILYNLILVILMPSAASSFVMAGVSSQLIHQQKHYLIKARAHIIIYIYNTLLIF